MSTKTGFYYDSIYLEHETGEHPENADRLRYLTASMENNALLSALTHLRPEPAKLVDIQRIHEPKYIENVQRACDDNLPYIGTADCVISPQTYEVALNASGAILQAVSKVADGELDHAFCAVRPPGHHAEKNQALGFCYFNNIAVAAEYLTQTQGFKRVLIFDFDVHHGNGTQHSFEDREDIFFASIHQDPRTCYPGTGFASEIGKGAGRGYTLNIPMPPFSGDEEYLQIFNQFILPKFIEYQPDFILLSAGFDAHRDDPLANQNLSVAAFDHMLIAIKKLASQFAKGRIVSILEGGYDYEALRDCVESHLEILLDDSKM